MAKGNSGYGATVVKMSYFGIFAQIAYQSNLVYHLSLVCVFCELFVAGTSISHAIQHVVQYPGKAKFVNFPRSTKKICSFEIFNVF